MEPTSTSAIISLIAFGIIVFIIYIMIRRYYYIKPIARLGFYTAILVPVLLAGVLFSDYVSDKKLRSEANNIVDKAIELADESAYDDNILKQDE